jgi:two-component system, sensor histidine kinase and response regulator
MGFKPISTCFCFSECTHFIYLILNFIKNIIVLASGHIAVIVILAVVIICMALYSFYYVFLKYRKEKIRTEALIRESILQERNQLRTLIDSMPDVIFIKDRQSRFVVVNKMVAGVMGTKPEALIGKTDFEFYTPDLAQRYYDDEQAIMQAGEAKINYEEPHLDEHGNRIILSTSKVPLKNSNGEVIGIVGIGRDITRLKRIEIQLRKKTEDLQETNRLLEERQEEIMDQSEELAAQAQYLTITNTELDRLNKTKDKFFSIIAHDLRNPFNAIMGFSELLCRDFNEMDDKQKLGLLELINLSSESAYNLLDNLLQWARTQTDKIKFSPEYFELSEMVKQVIDLHGIIAEKKQITLESAIPDSTRVFADKNMIHTVIRNLISNAIKFSHKGGKVFISSFENGAMTEVVIRDQGIGMSRDNLSMLFRIDTYYSTAGTSGESGTGLGLIICKEFVEKNQGRIRASSKPGEGTAISFTLMR